MNLPQTFEELMKNPIIMITIPRQRDTRASVSQAFYEKCGFTVNLSGAIDGWEKPIYEYAEQSGIKFADPYPELAGLNALTFTYFWMMKDIVMKKTPYVFVVEDDTLPHPDIKTLGQSYWAETPKNFDFLFIGNSILPPSPRIVVEAPSSYSPAMIITLAGATRFLDLVEENKNHLESIDILLYKWSKRGMITSFCWNGTAVALPYPVNDPKQDSITSDRCSGLIYQNFRLGSTLLGHDIVYPTYQMTLPVTFAELMTRGGVMITLPRHQARADYSRQKLTDAGFKNIQSYTGVDGFSEDLSKYPWKLKDMGPGQKGIAVTTLNLYKKVVDENLPYLLIFEDDVLPHPDIANLGELWWQETPKDFDFLFLGNQMNPYSTAKVVSQPCFCLHAYIVSNKGAHRALELVSQLPVVEVIDIQLIMWMQSRQVVHYQWSGVGVPKPYPIAVPRVVATEDTIWDCRDSGLFYQNFYLGSSIHSKDLVFG